MAGVFQNYLVVIKIVDVGGDEVDAVSRMIGAGLYGVEFTVMNTDTQALPMSDTDVRLDVGCKLIRGLGVGADPSKGRQVAGDHSEDIEGTLKGADMIFVIAGEGGGTGARAAPIVAKTAHSSGTLMIGAATRPFSFEGRHRATQADSGIEALWKEADTLIVIPDDKLLQITDYQVIIFDAFKQADRVLMQGVSSITDLIITPGLINLDFTDVKSIMNQAGFAPMGIGSARGEDRARAAAEMTISSPLLEASIDGIHGVSLPIASGPDLGLLEVSAATQLIEEAAYGEVNIIFSTVIDDILGDKARITVIVVDFDGEHPSRLPCLEAARSNQQQPPQPCGGFGGVPGGSPSPLAGGTPLTGGGSSRLAPPHVTPTPLARPEPRPLRVDNGDDLDVPDSMK